MNYRTPDRYPYTIEQSQQARAYVTYAICKGINVTSVDARNELRDRLGARSEHADVLVKAISPMMTGTGSDALGAYQQVWGKLAERPTLLGRMVGTINAPVGLPIAIQTTPTIATWIGETDPIPVSLGALDNKTLPIRKIATISVFSRESARQGGDAVVTLVEGNVTGAVVRGANVALLDAQPADADRPASILYGIAEIGTGSPFGESGISALIGSVRSGEPVAPYFIASSSGALYLATLRDGSGARLFPGLTILGGELLGIPLLISAAAGSKLVLVDAAALLVWFGGVELDASSEASLQMTATPSDGATQAVSLWQAGLTAIRAIQSVSWALSASDGAGFVTLPL